MKKTDVKKTERSKSVYSVTRIHLERRRAVLPVWCVQFYGKTAINILAGKEKTGIGKAIYGESNHGKSNYGKSNHEKSVQGDTEQLVRTHDAGS